MEKPPVLCNPDDLEMAHTYSVRGEPVYLAYRIKASVETTPIWLTCLRNGVDNVILDTLWIDGMCLAVINANGNKYSSFYDELHVKQEGCWERVVLRSQLGHASTNGGPAFALIYFKQWLYPYIVGTDTRAITSLYGISLPSTRLQRLNMACKGEKVISLLSRQPDESTWKAAVNRIAAFTIKVSEAPLYHMLTNGRSPIDPEAIRFLTKRIDALRVLAYRWPLTLDLIDEIACGLGVDGMVLLSRLYKEELCQKIYALFASAKRGRTGALDANVRSIFTKHAYSIMKHDLWELGWDMSILWRTAIKSYAMRRPLKLNAESLGFFLKLAYIHDEDVTPVERLWRVLLLNEMWNRSTNRYHCHIGHAGSWGGYVHEHARNDIRRQLIASGSLGGQYWPAIRKRLEKFWQRNAITVYNCQSCQILLKSRDVYFAEFGDALVKRLQQVERSPQGTVLCNLPDTDPQTEWFVQRLMAPYFSFVKLDKGLYELVVNETSYAWRMIDCALDSWDEMFAAEPSPKKQKNVGN